MNKVELLGRLVADPTVKKFEDGGQQTSYRLAVDRPYKNRKGEREADFLFCQATGVRGEFAEKWLSKGMMIAVVGSVRTRSWQDDSKKWHNMTWIDVMEHYFTGAKENTNRVAEDSASGEPLKEKDYKQVSTDDDDDELPF